MNKIKCYTDNGYIALISVLISGAVISSVVASLLLFGLGAGRSSFILEQSNQAKSLTNTCAEEALQQIRNSLTFVGLGNLSVGFGDCSYTVSNNGAQNREIIATGNVGSVTRKVRVVIDSINPQINIVSWEELSDF